MRISPKQAAQALGVSESSVKRWCDAGLIPISRTAGGHRRLDLSDVLQYLRKSGRPIVRPEVLGLPSNTGRTEANIRRAANVLEKALLADDEEQCRRITFDLYLAGHTACEILERVVSPAFVAIGESWGCGEAAIYEERRACEIANRVMFELRAALPSVSNNTQLAIGGTLKGDPYRLGTISVEIALREAGWWAESYGSNLPAQTLCKAIANERPRLVWLSISHIESTEALIGQVEAIYEAAAGTGAVLAVGGRAFKGGIRERIRCSIHCDTLRDLVAYVATLRTVSTAEPRHSRA